MASKKTSVVPPLLALQVSNPVTYIKKWWDGVMKNEGVKLTLQVKPLTAVMVGLAFSGLGYGVGRLSIPDSISQYIPALASINGSTVNEVVNSSWRETAFTGDLQKSVNKYFLVTTAAEAISLDVNGYSLDPTLVTKRVMVVGSYNKESKVIKVVEVSGLE